MYVYVHTFTGILHIHMLVVVRVNSTGSDGTPSPAPVIATTVMEYYPVSNPVITSLLTGTLTFDEGIITVDNPLITHTVYICSILLINSGGSHDTLKELEETLSTVIFLVALGTVGKVCKKTFIYTKTLQLSYNIV